MITHTPAPIDAKVSIGMDKELKTQMESEANQLGIKLSVYARAILKKRNSLLENGTSDLQDMEELTRLQTENERLRLMLEREAVSEETSTEYAEEINALTAENEALRADMELLRADTEKHSDTEVIVAMEEDLTAANATIQKAGVRLSNLEKEHELEKQNLIVEYEKMKQDLTEEVNALTCIEMSDEESELILQHEKEFEEAMQRLRKEEEISAEKTLVIEELRGQLTDYESQQAKSSDEDAEKLTAAHAKIVELEEELSSVLYEKEASENTVESIQERGRKIQSKYDSLFYDYQAATEKLSKVTRNIDDLQEQLEQIQSEKEETDATLMSRNETVNQLKVDLEEAQLQTRQLLIKRKEQQRLLDEMRSQNESLKEDKKVWERSSDQFYQNAENAISKYEKQINTSHELRTQCKKQEELIGKYKIKLNQFMDEISELQTKLRKPDAYSDLQITKFAQEEMQLYTDCLDFLRTKHKNISNNNLLLASLLNSVKNKQTVLVSTPYTTSLKAVMRAFRA